MKHLTNFINEGIDLSYTSFFGEKVTHNEALQSNIRDSILNIIMNENRISEKSFSEIDNQINNIKETFTTEMYSEAFKMYEEGKRINYIGEILYDKYFKIHK